MFCFCKLVIFAFTRTIVLGNIKMSKVVSCMIELTEKTKGVILFLLVFVIMPLCMTLRVQQLDSQEQTNTVNYYEK